MATKNPTFLNRRTEDDTVDYISAANDQLNADGTIDPESAIYQNAIAQYNKDLIKGSTTRLEVPQGYCGYIDPNSGEFRVEPVGFDTLLSSTLYPNDAENASDVPPLEPSPWPIDCQLQYGLPGSYDYTVPPEGDCKEKEDGDNECSGIAWYSGAGEGAEGGTDQLSASVCGAGDGINSNTGVASSESVGGLSSGCPPIVVAKGDTIALGIYPPNGADTGAGRCNCTVGGIFGTVTTYNLFYNVHATSGTTGADNFKQCGFKVSVRYDNETANIVGTSYERTWET